MLIQLTKTNGGSLGLNSDEIWKFVETPDGCNAYDGTKVYNLSTSYAEVKETLAGDFAEFDYQETPVVTRTILLNKNFIAFVKTEYSQAVIVLKNGDKYKVDATYAEVFDLYYETGGSAAPEEKTHLEMLEMAETDGFTVGQLYKITGYTDTGTVLYFRAATTSKLEKDGIRTMLCPAYYGQGENNGDGNNWIGVWNANRTPGEGDLTIWGGKVWRNLTGDVGSEESTTALDETNWLEIGKGDFAANEYVEMVFGCSYDLENNWIEKQWDGAGNVFGMDYLTEQEWWGWGYNLCDVSDWNHATSGYAFANNRCIGGVWNNSCFNIVGNYITDDAIYGNFNDGDIYNNTTGGIYNNSNIGDIRNNSNNGPIAECTSGEDPCNIYQNNNNGPITGTFDADVTEYGTVSLEFESDPATGTATGPTTTFTANEGQGFGDAVFINGDGKAQLGDADAIATASCIALCTDSVSADETGTYLLHGFACNDTWNWTVGGLIYLSATGTTGNTLTQTAPTGTDTVIQILGVATHATRIYFNVQLLQIENE